MEVKINKEIREYTEKIFFGLSLRQFIFSILACGMAVILYFLLKDKIGLEVLSWLCILGATPFAILGFVTYNGLTAEKFLIAWVKSKILIPKELKYLPDNLYYEMLTQKNKEGKIKDEKTKRNIKKR